MKIAMALPDLSKLSIGAPQEEEEAPGTPADSVDTRSELVALVKLCEESRGLLWQSHLCAAAELMLEAYDEKLCVTPLDTSNSEAVDQSYIDTLQKQDQFAHILDYGNLRSLHRYGEGDAAFWQESQHLFTQTRNIVVNADLCWLAAFFQKFLGINKHRTWFLLLASVQPIVGDESLNRTYL